MFYNDGKKFMPTYFNAFDITEWFDLNSNSKYVFEILSIKEFLVNFSICLCILFMALKTLVFFNRLILINSQVSSFSIAF